MVEVYTIVVHTHRSAQAHAVRRFFLQRRMCSKQSRVGMRAGEQSPHVIPSRQAISESTIKLHFCLVAKGRAAATCPQIPRRCEINTEKPLGKAMRNIFVKRIQKLIT